jgi:aspartate racemase
MNGRKKLGIIGGMGSRAGALFLNKIIDYSPAVTDQDFLEIIFHNNAQIPDRTKAIVAGGASPLEGFYRSFELFNQNQVEVIALACMTAYYYYDKIIENTQAEVINPLQLLARHLHEEYKGVKRIGLLATTGAINSGLYHTSLASSHVDVVTLSAADQEAVFMRAVYMKNGFKSAVISSEAMELMFLAMKKLRAMDVDLLIGGCTEVSIGIDPAAVPVPYIDTLDLLARKTVACCYNAENSTRQTQHTTQSFHQDNQPQWTGK